MPDLNILRKEGSSCTELLECFYGLNKNECEAFYIIAARGEATLDELSALIKRDRSTTHRLLQKLVNLELCYKEKATLQKGGYVHIYKPVSIARVREILESRISEYITDINKLASKIESDLAVRIDEHR